MKTVGEDCNFDDLPNIIIIFKVLLPMIIGIPATFLIPNVLQTEPLIDWNKEKWCEDVETEEGPGTLLDSNDDEDDEAGDSRIEPHLL